MGLISFFSNANTYTVYSINAPPLTMLNIEKAGIVGDVVIEAFQRLGHQVKLEELPWKRAQRIVSQGDNTFIMPLALLPSREASFTWIAYIMDLERSFATTHLAINSYPQAHAQLTKIGVGQGSAQANILRSKGFSKSQIVEIKIGPAAAQMLQLGRIDAWFNGTPESIWYWNQQFPKKSLIIGNAVESNSLFLAASKKADAELVQALALTIQHLHDEGFVEKTKQRYLGGINQ
ncbi:substrate-binding periplasmic protein [Agarivorans sp. MS3-6]|uniref:substrate-binding periplasmic protein n=1 Tax=Agarivorans sp. TSD2052 TaxID=2937286 RepID=UPI00200EF5AE|nr:transporter substrate-binding domain-containing protein [Agarivorans sp. TSD2052]UPW19307.1 transporter substrate-binding domain-containing protein [Agarivorans sp. TSD2052]